MLPSAAWGDFDSANHFADVFIGGWVGDRYAESSSPEAEAKVDYLSGWLPVSDKSVGAGENFGGFNQWSISQASEWPRPTCPDDFCFLSSDYTIHCDHSMIFGFLWERFLCRVLDAQGNYDGKIAAYIGDFNSYAIVSEVINYSANMKDWLALTNKDICGDAGQICRISSGASSHPCIEGCKGPNEHGSKSGPKLPFSPIRALPLGARVGIFAAWTWFALVCVFNGLGRLFDAGRNHSSFRTRRRWLNASGGLLLLAGLAGAYGGIWFMGTFGGGL
jgi:hypothetical protein